MVFSDIDVVFRGETALNTNYFLLLLQKMRTSCSFTFQTCTIQKFERNRQSVFWRTFASNEPFTPRNNIFRVKVIDYSATGTNNSGFCIGATTNNKYRDSEIGMGVFIGGAKDIGLSWAINAKGNLLHNGVNTFGAARLERFMQKGSIVEVLLHFSTAELRFFLNGDPVGLFTVSLADKIYPAVASMGNFTFEQVE
jgi:hypothetical protein